MGVAKVDTVAHLLPLPTIPCPPSQTNDKIKKFLTLLTLIIYVLLSRMSSLRLSTLFKAFLYT